MTDFRLEPSSRDTQPAKKATPRQSLFMSLLLFFFAFVLLAFCLHTSKTRKELLTHGLRTTGEIVRIKEEWTTHTRTVDGRTETTRELLYRAVVAFRDTAGRRHEFNDDFSSGTLPYYKGQNVNVIYMKDNPAKKVLIDRGFMNWLGPAVLGIVGLLCLLLGGCALWQGLRPETPENKT